MYTLYAIWSRPSDEDIDAFEDHYTGTHAPLASVVPNMRRFMTTRTTDGLAGGDPAPSAPTAWATGDPKYLNKTN